MAAEHLLPVRARRAYARGDALNVAVEAPTYVTEPHGEVPLLESIATWDPEDGAVTFFMVNRSLDRPLPVTAELVGLGELVVHEHLVLAADGDVRRRNTEQAPGAVTPRASQGSLVTGNALATTLEPLSWNVVRLVPATKGGSRSDG